MASESSPIELLLAAADDSRPALSGGLPAEAAELAPAPKDGRTDEGHLGDPGGDPNDLPAQRWGIVAPVGTEGDRLLAAVNPLLRAREEDMGCKATVYRVPPDMDAHQSIDWMLDEYAPDDVDEADVPRYLLLLGDLTQISADLQQLLAVSSFPGRITFPDESGYEAYVDKVLRWQRKPAAVDRSRMLYYTVHDGSGATQTGYRGLVQPGVQRARARMEKGALPARQILEFGDTMDPDPDEFLDGVREPADVLFSVSHGAGAPRKGWKNQEEQRRLQGAMSFGRGDLLAGIDLADEKFLPGGAWFYLACYGAGTPSRSAYHHWLSRLKDHGEFGERLGPVLHGLPKKGSAPFISSIPQSVLANPDGPLCVISHLDLAWTYGFQDVGPGGRSHSSRFHSVLEALVRGRRAGVALHPLVQFFGQTNAELTTLYDRAERHKGSGNDDAKLPKIGHVWMRRQDLMGYLLLGDPAVRLPLSERPPDDPTLSIVEVELDDDDSWDEEDPSDAGVEVSESTVSESVEPGPDPTAPSPSPVAAPAPATPATDKSSQDLITPSKAETTTAETGQAPVQSAPAATTPPAPATARPPTGSAALPAAPMSRPRDALDLVQTALAARIAQGASIEIEESYQADATHGSILVRRTIRIQD